MKLLQWIFKTRCVETELQSLIQSRIRLKRRCRDDCALAAIVKSLEVLNKY